MKQNKMKISIKWNLQNLFCKPLAYFHLANSRFLLSKSLAYFHYTNSRISFCFVLFHFISLIVKPILLVSTNGNISKSIENMHTDIRSQSKRIPIILFMSSKGYLHLTRTFFPRRSLHVTSIISVGRKQSFKCNRIAHIRHVSWLK